MDNMMILQLQSCTVFWNDLRLIVSPSVSISNRDGWVEVSPERAYDRWLAEMKPWLEQFAKGHWNIFDAGVWFADRRDAIMFKLRWTTGVRYWV